MKTPEALKISQMFCPEAFSTSDVETKIRPFSSANMYWNEGL